MATFRKLEDIIAWQKARVFCRELEQYFPLYMSRKEFELLNQLKKSSGSMMDNIAEGFGRMGNREFCNFLTIAHGSALESISQLTRSFDWDILEENIFIKLKGLAEEVARLIQALIGHLLASEHKGIKFK